MMLSEDERRAAFSAVAIAMAAKAGSLEPRAVRALEGFISDRLAPASPSRLAAQAFADRWAEHRRDRTALAEAGEILHRDIMRALWPAPSDLERVDIHG